jgi:hypothetical protein
MHMYQANIEVLPVVEYSNCGKIHWKATRYRPLRHPERSEASRGPSKQTFRSAQGDN